MFSYFVGEYDSYYYEDMIDINTVEAPTAESVALLRDSEMLIKCS